MQNLIDIRLRVLEHTEAMKAKYVLCTMLLSTCIFAVASAAQQPAGSAATTSVRISPADAAALLIEKVVPPYPEEGLASRIQNNEVLDIEIDEQGNVTGAKVRSGHPFFARTSLAAVRQWKYRPYPVNGSPVRVETTVLIAFRFPGSDFTPKTPEGLSPSAISSAGPLPEAPRTAEFGKLVLDAKALDSRLANRVEPRYPEMAKVAHIQGDVFLYVLIDKDGHVAKLHAVSGHPILIPAAMDAVKQWTYKPYEVGGDVVEVEGKVKVEFRSEDTETKQ
jgi:TonB family protein